MKVQPNSFKTIACRHGEDTLLYLINMHGVAKPVNVQLGAKKCENIKRIIMEPSGRELKPERSGKKIGLTIKDNIDPVAIILRLTE